MLQNYLQVMCASLCKVIYIALCYSYIRCIMLQYTAFYYSHMCCDMLWSCILHYGAAMFYCIMLQSIYCIILQSCILHYVAVKYLIVIYSALYYIHLYCIMLQWSILHYFTVKSTALCDSHINLYYVTVMPMDLLSSGTHLLVNWNYI